MTAPCPPIRYPRAGWPADTSNPWEVTISATTTELRIATLAQRPDLTEALLTMESTWPAYIRAEPVLIAWAFERHADFQFVVLDEDDKVIARAASVPFHWDGGRDSLPDTGWDEMLRQSMLDTYAGRPLSTLCALEIAVVPGLQARNLSGRVLAALGANGRRLGCQDMVAPVRPSNKHTEPHLPMADYVARTRPDGLPTDAWLRVHVRAGGRIVKVCPVSMTVGGSLSQWRDWTGLPFDTSGPVVVPGALNPVEVCVEHDHAVYIEPNVWVHHHLNERCI